MKIIDLTRKVLVGIAGVPTALAVNALRETATEFLTKTKLWDEVLPPVRVLANVNEYPLDPGPADSRCIGVRAIYAPWMPRGQMLARTIAQLARENPNWQAMQGSLPSHYTTALGYDFIRVFPMPANVPPDSQATRMTVHAVYTLSAAATTIPDEILARWEDTLVTGARARLLMATKDAPWRDLELGTRLQREFADGLEEAQIFAEHGRGPAAVTVQPIPFR